MNVVERPSGGFSVGGGISSGITSGPLSGLFGREIPILLNWRISFWQCNSQNLKMVLLIQFRLFNNGCAVKGTLLVNKKLCVSEAADSWLALMDRLLILGNDCIEEKDRVKANILQLVDIYYDALDAPKKGGQKIEVLRELKAELFPHYMERENSFNSTSILGLIHDTVNSYQAEDLSMKGGLKDLLSDAVQLMKRLTQLLKKQKYGVAENGEPKS